MVVDDDRIIRRLASTCLERAGHVVEAFDSAEDCLRALSRILPDAILLDVSLPGMSGIEVLERVRSRNPDLPVIMLTADTTVDTVVATMQLGAWDYLPKPIDRNKLVTTIRNAVDHGRLSVQLRQLQRELDGRGYGDIIGRSPVMRQLFRQLDRIAASDISVLIHGESGTGKELVARAIHQNSGRAEGPFVVLNCAAIPATLQESELFGYEKGAFTGAEQRRIGRFEQADGGTLFLDEVGELSLDLQAKLLRAIQERVFTRVGGNTEVKSNFRLLTATHKSLRDLVEVGEFREDFYFRIAVFDLSIPALRERGEDVLLLADRFRAQFTMEGQRAPRLSEAAQQLLLSYAWPGNVRELENAIQRGMVAADGDSIGVRDLPRQIWQALDISDRRSGELPGVAREAGGHNHADCIPAVEGGQVLSMTDIERRAILLAIRRNDGNMTRVVRDLGMGRSTLYRKLKKYGINER